MIASSQSLNGRLQELQKPISVTWCHCCKGSIKSVLELIFKDKECLIDILETYSSGGNKCLIIFPPYSNLSISESHTGTYPIFV